MAYMRFSTLGEMENWNKGRKAKVVHVLLSTNGYTTRAPETPRAPRMARVIPFRSPLTARANRWAEQ